MIMFPHSRVYFIQGSWCVYEHGTVAFYLTRSLAEKLATVDKEVYCRYPIDMYILNLGPWFATTSGAVEHAGWGHTKIT